MKRNWFVILFSLIAFCGSSQPTHPATGKPDTSYTIYSIAIAISKSNPEAKIVNELHSPAIAEEKNIDYCNVGNRKLLLDVFYPKQKFKEHRIAVIIIYGGGWRTGNRPLHYPLAQHLAAMGYICFTPEYRLSPEALYPAAVYDIKSAIDRKSVV